MPDFYAPIALFVYARPEHTRRTIESLAKNTGAEFHDLIVFSDGAKGSADWHQVEQVRDYLKTVTGFRSVAVHSAPQNLGLANSIIAGVTRVLEESESIIVLEDDMETSPFFLNYMDEALEKFREDDRVISVHGWTFPTSVELPEAFFMRGADCWGWATWRRGWAKFNPDGKSLLNRVQNSGLTGDFNLDGAHDFVRMLKDQSEGQNDSWAIRWHASAFLANKLTLYPGRSLVQNIGNDSSGTHCGTNPDFEVNLSESAVILEKFTDADVVESATGRSAFKKFFQQRNRLSTKAFKMFGALSRRFTR